jgi:hypothetical protein
VRISSVTVLQSLKIQHFHPKSNRSGKYSGGGRLRQRRGFRGVARSPAVAWPCCGDVACTATQRQVTLPPIGGASARNGLTPAARPFILA